MFKKARIFIKDLRRSDDLRKKRWLWSSAIITMIIVIGLWAIYINLVLPKNENKNEPASAAASSDSFLEVFGKGFKVVVSDLQEKKRLLASDLSQSLETFRADAQKTNNLEIKKESPSLFFKEMESIPKGSFGVARTR